MGIWRRRLVFSAGTLLLTPRGFAQPRHEHNMAILSGGRPSDLESYLREFLIGMRALGHREGDNLSIDARYAEYSPERAGKYAAEIAGRKPTVILANGAGITPAVRLTPPIPVVFLHSGDPIEAGYADSWARPGRNGTGISLMALDLIAKRMEALKEAKPSMRRLAFLASPLHPGQKRELAASRAAAAQIGAEVTYYEVRTPADLAAALPALAAARPDGAILFSDALMSSHRRMLAEFFLEHRIPSAAGWSAFPESGHLLSFGPERNAVWRRLAYFVDKILKGARAADLPIELPTTFELVVNRRTAAAMGLSLPQTLLLRASQVIE